MKKLLHFKFSFDFFRNLKSGFILLFAILVSQGCFLHYYKTNTTHEIKADTLKKLANDEKYFILHDNKRTFALSHVSVSDSSIEANLDSILTAHEENLHPKSATHNRFPAVNEPFVLNEVHIYIKTPIQYESQ